MYDDMTKNTNQSLNKSIDLLEGLVDELSSIKQYIRNEEKLVDHSDLMRRLLIGMTSFSIILMLVVGCCQGFILKLRLVNRKKE